MVPGDCLSGLRALAFLPIACGLGKELVPQLGVTRRPHAGNQRRLRTHPSPNVYGDMSERGRSSSAASQLACGAVVPRRIPLDVDLQARAGRTDDAGAV